MVFSKNVVSPLYKVRSRRVCIGKQIQLSIPSYPNTGSNKEVHKLFKTKQKGKLALH